MNLLTSHGLLVVSTVLQITVVLAGCWSVARWMKHRSATLAHGVSIAGLLGILIIPVGLLVKAPWEVTVPAMSRGVETDTVTAMPVVALSTNLTTDVTSSTAAVAPPLNGTVALASPRHLISGAETSEQSRDVTTERAGLISTVGTWSMANWLVVIWFLVAGCLLTRIMAAVLRLRSIKHCSTPAPSNIAGAADELRQRLGICQHVDVRVNFDENRMPVAFWWHGWTVCIPKVAIDWDAGLLRSVLAHELGHVARRDAATDLLGQVASVVYWFHPLVWLSVGSSRRLREQACDDLVLASVGMQPKQYANHLLDVVSRCVEPRNQLASAIARSSNIETRIRRILASESISIPTVSRSRVVMSLVLLSAVAVSTLRLTLQATESLAAEVTRDTTGEVDADDLVSVRGKVYDEKGKPYPAAEVVLRVIVASFDVNLGMQRKPDVMARTQTDHDGRFSISEAAIPAAYRNHDTGEHPLLELLVTTPDHGLTYKSFNKNVDTLEVTLRPKRDFSGVVVDSDGNPIADTVIEVYSIGDASAPFDIFAKSEAYSNLQFSSFAPTATTNANGQFRFENLPDGSLIGFNTRHADYQQKYGFADNSNGTKPYTLESNYGDHKVLATPLRIELERGYRIELKLSDSDGKPVGTSPNIVGPRTISRMTKVEPGKFVVTCRDSGKCYIRADIPSARLSLGKAVEITDGHLERPCKLDIQVPLTRPVLGRVVNDAGKGVADVEVHWSNLNDLYSTAITDIEGNYEIHVVPGKGELRYAGNTDGQGARDVLLPIYNAVSVETKPPALSIDVPESGAADIPDMFASRGLILSGVVKDSSGALAAGAKIEVFTADRVAPMNGKATTDDEGRYSISGLNPDADYYILVTHESEAARDKTNKQNAIVLAKATEGGVEYFDTVQIVKNMVTSETVALAGRVLLDGKPMAEMPIELDVGTEIQMQYQVLGARGNTERRDTRGTRYSMVAATKTNAEGEYEILGVLQGEEFQVRLRPPFPAIAPGWNYQSPYAAKVPDIVPSMKYSLGDANLVRLGQSLSGRIVDPDGNPVAGATVSAGMADGRMLSRVDSRVLDAPPPWTKSDANGRFRLTHLPEQPIQLMAYFANPEGGQIRFPAKSKPDLNQQDIEMILDRSLQQE